MERDQGLPRERLADELRRAYLSFQRAKIEYDTAIELLADLENTDGNYALLTAAAEYDKSLTDYCEALKRFCGFALRDTIRPEQEARREPGLSAQERRR